MCEPTTIAAATAAMTSVAQGYQARQQGKFQEGVSRYNARQLQNEATQTRNIAVEQENEQRRATAEFASRQKAQFAASGVDVTAGSPASIIQDTETLGEIDALRIRSNLGLQAESLEQQSTLELARGEQAAEAGRQAFQGSLLGAVGGFLGTEAGFDVAKKWFTPRSAAFNVETSTPAPGVNPRDFSSLA